MLSTFVALMLLDETEFGVVELFQCMACRLLVSFARAWRKPIGKQICQHIPQRLKRRYRRAEIKIVSR